MAKKLHQNTIKVKSIFQSAGFFVQATSSIELEICKTPLCENDFADNIVSSSNVKKHDYNFFFITVWVFAKKNIEIHLPHDLGFDFREVCTIDNVLEYICSNYDTLEKQWIERRAKEREKLDKIIAEIRKKYYTNGS